MPKCIEFHCLITAKILVYAILHVAVLNENKIIRIIKQRKLLKCVNLLLTDFQTNMILKATINVLYIGLIDHYLKLAPKIDIDGKKNLERKQAINLFSILTTWNLDS